MAERIISILRKTHPTFEATDYVPEEQYENETQSNVNLNKLFKPTSQTHINKKIKKKRYDELDEIMNLTVSMETKIEKIPNENQERDDYLMQQNGAIPSPTKPVASVPRHNQKKKRGN